ncbi:hypothetical protein CDV36_015838 [Fusarium kuroshium]|uniref:Uncharacterized protein n=2 Tax=Fusarium solani species complex TaxID=232080 RepID=A0A3M2R5S0_9HYPO|nr:hypothetical protein CDV36_015838 [Fusarium kuroshium]
MEKLQYNAERLVSSAVVRAYDVMIKEGGAYSTLANGFVRVLLHVPYDDLATLYYHLCEPNGEIDGEDEQSMQQQPRSSVARVLCLCFDELSVPAARPGVAGRGAVGPPCLEDQLRLYPLPDSWA